MRYIAWILRVLLFLVLFLFALKNYEVVPLKFYFDFGLRVTINTNNRLITDTTVTKELVQANKVLGFSLEDIVGVLISGFKSAFLPFHVKQQYLRRVSEELNAFNEESVTEPPPAPLAGSTPHAPSSN